MNRKGIFFTFAAIALSIVIIFSFKVYSDFGLKDEMEVIEIRINTMNNFILDLENDLENAIFITGFRSLLSLEDYLMENNAASGAPYNFLDDLGTDLDTAFDEVFRLGTITGTSGTENMDILDNNTFLNWTDRIKLQSDRTNIKLEFNIDSVTIRQSGPWTVEVKVQLDIDIDDEKNTASWTITNKEYTAQINITSDGSTTKFVDPLYLVNTDGVANNTIRETPYTSWPTDLSAHLTEAKYRLHSDAPSYLDRFNDVNSGTNGIESLVTLRLKSKGISIDTSKSSVDYLYFGTSPSPCDVAEIGDSDFVLDDPTHTTFYGATCV